MEKFSGDKNDESWKTVEMMGFPCHATQTNSGRFLVKEFIQPLRTKYNIGNEVRNYTVFISPISVFLTRWCFVLLLCLFPFSVLGRWERCTGMSSQYPLRGSKPCTYTLHQRDVSATCRGFGPSNDAVFSKFFCKC